MRLIVSFETSIGFDDDILYVIHKKLKKVKEALVDRDYGDAFTIVGIIPSICSDSFLEGWRERKLFKVKAKNADIRLIMDFNKFAKADKDMQYKLFLKCMSDSIDVITEYSKKKKLDFQGDKLKADIFEMLNVKYEDIADLEALDPRPRDDKKCIVLNKQ